MGRGNGSRAGGGAGAANRTLGGNNEVSPVMKWL